MKTSNCQLCGNKEELTFEHVPPRAAFNKKPVLVQYHEHLIKSLSPLYGKYSKAPKGFGSYSLCKSCNNNTGNWYAKDYADFAMQGMTNILNITPQYWVEGSYKIKPLNVIKQMLTMFVCADKSTVLQSDKNLINFILDRNSKKLPEKYRLYLFSSLSKHSRRLGYCIVFENGIVNKWSEINHKPFGIFLTEKSSPAYIDQVDITSFKRYEYNEEALITLKLPYLDVYSPEIGRYKLLYPKIMT